MRLSSLALGAPFPDIELAYVDWGAPDAEHVVVCVHGLTRNSRDFDFLAAALADRGMRIIAVDVVGRGRSTWLDDPQAYAVPAYAAHLAHFLERLSLPSVDWVGTSMGGLVGMFVAAAGGTPIRRLILNDIGPFVPSEALRQIRSYLGLELRFATLGALEAHLRTIHAPFGPLTDAQWRHLAQHGARPSEGGWVLGYDPAIRIPFQDAADDDLALWEVWDAIRAPTLVLHGADSILLTPRTTTEMMSRGPTTAVIDYPNVGHAPALMSSDQIADIERWLAATAA
jgi:pimeloyl-ACP methyl ester carboxylesterase